MENEEDLRPTEGVRLLMERVEESSDSGDASYRAAIFTVEKRFSYTLQLSMAGEASLSAKDEGQRASAEDEEKLLKMAKSTARAAKRKQDEGLAPWPPRVLRWRGPGRG